MIILTFNDKTKFSGMHMILNSHYNLGYIKYILYQDMIQIEMNHRKMVFPAHQHNSPCAYFLRIGFTSFNCPLDLIEFFYCVSIHTQSNSIAVILVQTCIASANNSENVINISDRTNAIANKENFGSCTNSFIQTIRKLTTKYLLQ